MPLRMPRRAGLNLKTGQLTCYFIGDDGDVQSGLTKRYEVLTTGPYAGTVNLDIASYAAATLAFVNATSLITDSANGVAHVKTGDTIVIKGSDDNDTVLTVKTGNVAGQIEVNETLTEELAGAYVSIYKRTTHANAAVKDLVTGKMWSRTTSNAEKVGPTSNGLLNWYNAATCFTLHPAAADLQMVGGVGSGTLKVVGGAAEITRYHVGDLLACSGFAGATNNLPGLYVTLVAVNGADLDISVDSGNQTLVSEAAGGSRAIKLVCQSIFNYAAAARAALLGGYEDWRVPNTPEMSTLADQGAVSALPDTTAFPAWPTTLVWVSSTRPGLTTQKSEMIWTAGADAGAISRDAATATRLCALIRG